MIESSFTPLNENIFQNKLDEKRIRNAIHSRLIQYHHNSDKSLVVDELGLDHGVARIDIAIVNGDLCGIEIKSPLDNLKRLPSQAEIYNLYFNKVTLVFAEKFFDEILPMVPKWWKLVAVVEGNRGGLHLKLVRPGKLNRNTDSTSIVKLLWRNEVIDLLRKYGISENHFREAKSNLYSRLIEILDHKTLQECVCSKLRLRENWRSH